MEKGYIGKKGRAVERRRVWAEKEGCRETEGCKNRGGGEPHL